MTAVRKTRVFRGNRALDFLSTAIIKLELVATDSTLIRVENVSRVYRSDVEEIYAVRQISLSVRAGELVLIRGKSGSGKTTLLNLMGGLEKPSQGHVYYEGKSLSLLSARQTTQWRRHQVGFVFQAFALIPELSACENVDLPLRIAGSRPREATHRALDCLERVGLSRRAHHRISELSGGEQQRVAIARCLVAEPRIVFADEPTGELDQATGLRMIELFRAEVEERNTAICLTSHDPQVAVLADRIFTLEDGKVVAEA